MSGRGADRTGWDRRGITAVVARDRRVVRGSKPVILPMLLIIPMMTASDIAADAIAGERERRTLEGLLLTPLTDRGLFVAKLLGAWLPAVGIGIAGGVAYAVVALVVSQAAGVLAISPTLLFAVGVAAWVIAVLVLRTGMRAVSRTHLGQRL